MVRRIRIVFTLSLLFFILVLARLYTIQVSSFDILRSLAEKQRLSSIKVPAQRGEIFDSQGASLVINQTAYQVYLEPGKINNRDELLSYLSKNLDIEESTIAAKLSDPSLVWVPVADRVDEEIINKMKKEKLEAVNFIEKSKRFYPEASMAAHLLGFVGKNDAGDNTGYFGIEGYYNEQLSGKDGYIIQEKDLKGNPILLGEETSIDPEDGRDLTLYLDRTVQFIAETKLEEGIAKYGAQSGAVIILDPYTGGILASASLPSYDSENYFDFDSSLYPNPVVAHSYEPGSTFKVLVMAAVLNEGKISLDDKYNEEGPVEIGGYAVRTWNNQYHGKISISEILQYSSNVGMVFIQEKLGNDLLLSYIENLGFGEKTGVDLQEEASPILRDKNKWYKIDFATASFGQGIAVTPLQMIRAVAAIANGGKLLIPKAVKSIRLESGEVIKSNIEIERQIFEKSTSSIVTEMMVSAVENGETKYLKPARYRIAGKTGTAQIPIEGHYDEDKTIASFVGFAPSDDPRFVMLVTLVKPTSSPWGSETAAPLFFDIAKELFLYFGVTPS